MVRKKYQIFVGSTYEDLREERANVMQALLEMDCIPSGMELFTASDDTQWELIRDVINECDYFVLILGGRYGSVDSDGTGFIEKEYRYAIDKNKPTIAFLHKDPSAIPKFKTENSDEGQKRLENFRQYVSQKLYVNWSTADELGARVSRSLIQLQRKRPADGWIRASNVSLIEANDEIVSLKTEKRKLEEELNSIKGSKSIAEYAATQFRENEFYLLGKRVPGVTYFKFFSSLISVPRDIEDIAISAIYSLKSYGNDFRITGHNSLIGSIGIFNIYGLVDYSIISQDKEISHSSDGIRHFRSELDVKTIVKPKDTLSLTYNLLANEPFQDEFLKGLGDEPYVEPKLSFAEDLDRITKYTKDKDQRHDSIELLIAKKISEIKSDPKKLAAIGSEREQIQFLSRNFSDDKVALAELIQLADSS